MGSTAFVIMGFSRTGVAGCASLPSANFCRPPHASRNKQATPLHRQCLTGSIRQSAPVVAAPGGSSRHYRDAQTSPRGPRPTPHECAIPQTVRISKCRAIKAAGRNALLCPDQPHVAFLAHTPARSWIQRRRGGLHRAAKRIKLSAKEIGWLSFVGTKPLDARRNRATNPKAGWPRQRVHSIRFQ